MEQRMDRRYPDAVRWIRALGRLTVATSLALAMAPRVDAQTSTPNMTMKVVSATDGTPITAYKYLINLDNTGTTAQRLTPLGQPPPECTPQDPAYPLNCKWTSIAGIAGSAPIVTQGDQSDFGAGLVLPAGRYLVSVLADEHKLDGAHFTIGGTGMTEVTVRMQPYGLGLPDATIQAAVFEDVSPVNGAPDVPAERGLAGFQGHIADYLGEVTTDVYGGPLCGDGVCLSKCYIVEGGIDKGEADPIDTDGRCPRDIAEAGTAYTVYPGQTLGAAPVIEGKLKIPNVGPNRYALSITPPNGTGWVQTTTLEGNLDWDAWVMEGATGLDTEFVVAGEPFPAVIFGYVPGPTLNKLGSGSGSIKGVVTSAKIYVPTKGGVGGLPGTIWGGLAGAKLGGPVPDPWVALTDLSNGDSAVWVGRGNQEGAFNITGVPAGNYTLTWWDARLDYILDLVNVTVGAGEPVDMGILPLTGWWTYVDGYVFEDTNRNGKMDPGEPGIPGYTLTMRKRENSLMDRGATTVTTDATGHYVMENAYPMTQWLVLEAYDDLFYTTGVTFQADNQLQPTTHLGAGVDVSVLPIIGLSGRIDWGKHAYDPAGTSGGLDPRNGGIVGTVTYDTTRNELDPRYAAAEDWQPGISGLTVNLYAPVGCAASGPPCDATGRYGVEPYDSANPLSGGLRKGNLLNTYVTETWQRPTGCVARDINGDPLVHGTDEQVLPLDPAAECLEGPLMGVQFATYSDGTNFGASVNGNYGFGDGCFVEVAPVPPATQPTYTPGVFDPGTGTCTNGGMYPLPGGRDYLVEVEIPNDFMGRPLYKVTREEDINIGNGDVFVPAVPPPACVGPLHVVDSTGNPTFPGGPGTAIYEGTAMPLCTVKLVTLANGKSIVPVFNLFTDVPLPARFWGLIVDDLTFSANPKSLLYGEKAGVPFAPVGIYDYTNRLVTTVESDFNGLFDVLLPSTNRINCPTPSGVCANVYRFVGNDPGIPGRLNPNYKPEFRTIAAEFEALPGLIIPADLAPTQVGVTVQLPGGQTNSVSCQLEATTPQLFAVSQPYADFRNSNTPANFTITGQGFGATKGSGQVLLGSTPLPTTAWSDAQIDVTVPVGTTAGPRQLSILAANGQRTVNGLTFHVLGTGYSPTLVEVGPGKTFAPAETLPASADHAIQRALDAPTTPPGALVVVYPNNASIDPRQNPRGAYYENLIISRPVKLQGVGPGGVRADGTTMPGSIIDGGAFGGDSPVATDWYTRIGGLTWSGNQTVYDGAVISIFASSSGGSAFPTSYAANTAPSIDGFDLRGGDQQGFPGNINVIGGGPTGQPGGLITQGGAIFANAFARNLQITNNVIQNNGGAYGTIRIGTPNLPEPGTSNENDGVRILNNRVIANAGTNLAGGIGIFAGADGYEVASNDICGNFSAEYGGGLSVYGASPGGKIHHNRIYFNRSYDEGGGVMIAGQLPADPALLSPGSGPVDIYANLIQANLANDDGGGLRFLMAGNYPMNVYDNFIVNNVSTHEGGGVALNDAPDVRFYNNTVMKNLTTATAVTSAGLPAPAGLSTSLNSIPLQNSLGAGASEFSNPVLFNNIFWDNRAGTRSGAGVTGLDAVGAVNWDLGAADGSGLLSPTNSILQASPRNLGSVTTIQGNLTSDPAVIAPYDISVAFSPWRTNPAFIDAILVAVDLPPNLMGNYHIAPGSPAVNAGAASKTVGAVTVNAPSFDIDNQARAPAFDIGADEIATTVMADLSITKTDGISTATPGTTLTYVIVVSNAGPSSTNATVTDTFPAPLTGASWTCSATGGASCNGAGGSGSISRNVALPAGGSVTFTAAANLAANASGSLTNTATVAPAAGTIDPNLLDNIATDVDAISAPGLPALALLDAFNRNDGSLGALWAVVTSSIQVNGNQALGRGLFVVLPGQAIWSPGSALGPTQGAAFTFASTPASNTSLVLKANGSGSLPSRYIRVRYSAGFVLVESTTTTGFTFSTLGRFATGAFGTGDTLTAVANPDGTVAVWRTTAANVTTYVGRSAIASGFVNVGGRIGMQVPRGARVDDFRGGVPTP